MPPEDEEDGFDEWLARLTERRARRAAVEASVEARRAELKAQRTARLGAERARLQPMMAFLSKRLVKPTWEFDVMKSNGALPGPELEEVKIWFQGVTGSGKTLLQDLIYDALRERGLKVRRYEFGRRPYRRMEEQWVDLTGQNIDDVLTVEVDIEGLHKLLEPREDAA
jgi:hypothetical protein